LHHCRCQSWLYLVWKTKREHDIFRRILRGKYWVVVTYSTYKLTTMNLCILHFILYFPEDNSKQWIEELAVMLCSISTNCKPIMWPLKNEGRYFSAYNQHCWVHLETDTTENLLSTLLHQYTIETSSRKSSVPVLIIHFLIFHVG